MAIHIKVVCTQNVQTCIFEVNSSRIGIKLPGDTVYYERSSLPHATR